MIPIRLDAYPVNTSGPIESQNTRVVFTLDTVFVFSDPPILTSPPSPPPIIFQKRYDDAYIDPALNAYVATFDDDPSAPTPPLVITRSSGCGCGSILKIAKLFDDLTVQDKILTKRV